MPAAGNIDNAATFVMNVNNHRRDLYGCAVVNKLIACCIAVAFAFASLGGFPNSGKAYAGVGAGPVGVLASRAKSFTNTVGVGTPNTVAGSLAYPVFSYTGMSVTRAVMPIPGETNIDANNNYLAARGIRFDFLWANGFSNFPLTSCANNPTSVAGTTGLEDIFVAVYPGMMLANEGPNETNNFPVCYNNSAVATGDSGAVLSFAATPAEVVTVANYIYNNGGPINTGSGITVTDVTNPTAIPSNTTIVSATSTSVTLSTSATVTNGDTIQFQAQGITPPTNVASTASSVAWQTLIYNATQADTNLAGVKVTNHTSFVSGASPQPPSIPSTANYNNVHFYPAPGYLQPTAYVGELMAAALNPALGAIPGAPAVITETGWCTPSPQSGAVNQTTQAILLLNNYFDMFSAAVPYTTTYTMFDVNTGDASCFDNYGIYESDQATPKTAATAIRSMMTVLNDSGGTALTFTPGRLNYSISGLPAPGAGGGFSYLLEKSNGTFEIVIWNEPTIWDDTTHTEITPTTSPLTISLGLTATTVNVYDPMVGTSPISTASGVSSVTPSITKDPLIVEVIPATYTVTPPPYMANVVSSPSLPFNVTLGTGTFSGSQTITISDGGAGGTITPSVGAPGTSSVVVTPTVGTNSFTFTYAGSTAGAKTIAFSNAQGWYDPQPLGYYSATPIPPYDGTVWNNPAGPYPTGVTHGTYHSNLLNTDIGYVIYLPPQYATEPTTHFPVVYVFPGSGSNENSYVGFAGGSGDIYAVVQAAIVATTIKPMILVTINGGSSGDHRDAQPGSPDYGTFAPQTMLIYEGIPFIDATYRTIATKAGRALHGFSMGGQACMRFATKFPQMFSSAYCFAPASDDVAPNYPICPPGAPCSNVFVSEPTQISVLFSNNAAAWMYDSVWGSGAWNATNVNGLPIHVVAGSVDVLEPVAVDYFNLLDLAGVAHDALSVAPGCGHDYWCDSGYVGVDAPWEFASTNFP